MDDFEKLLELKEDLLVSQLKTVSRYRLRSHQEGKPIKRTSKLDIVENILLTANKSLHISEIIKIAQSDYQVALERDSTVSAIVKKMKAGIKFERVAPNTFTIKNN